MKKSGRLLQHGRVGAHAAARLVDAPALPGGVARPDERHWSGGRPARCGSARSTELADDRRRSQILEADAIEDVLAGRQVLDQRLGREIALGQHVDEHAGWMVLKLSTVETSTCIRDGRSARAQTMPESVVTSPDCTPCVDGRAVGGAAEIGSRHAIKSR